MSWIFTLYREKRGMKFPRISSQKINHGTEETAGK
jgi:hypothetical protein